MKRLLSVTFMLAIAVWGLMACSDDAVAQPNTPDNDYQASGFNIQMTTVIPSGYFSEATQQGAVERLEYDSKDYTSDDLSTTHKPVYVYLPYGYDATQKYDIIYLMHGYSGVAEEYFSGRSGNDFRMKNLFDNMIQHGLCRPFIAVSPTWDKDNRPKSWSESVREIAVFYNEYENELIPAVESKYSTYAETTDRDGIIGSRDHRAFGGFSLGAVTTWYIFEHCFDLQRFFLPMSGDCWHLGMYAGREQPEQTARFLASVINSSQFNGDNFHIWHCVGTDDMIFSQTDNQARACMDLGDTFTPENFSYLQREGGRHDFNSVWEFCYNVIPLFFPPIPEEINDNI